MTRTSTQDELLSDDPFYTVAGNSIQGSYIPAGAGGTTGGSTAGSVMSVTAGGITINLILDAAAQAAPASFKSGLQQAVAILAANITDKITVNINIDYSGTGGGAAAGPDSGYYESYAWTRSELVNNASAGDTTFNALPTGSTIQGQSNVAVWNAQLKLWGVLGANDTTTDDASATFATDINPNLLVGVAMHELTHAMGRVPYGSAPDIFDLYRFTSPGVRLFSGSQTAPAAYFSLDGGATKLADYGQSSDPSDFLNSGVQGSNDPFNEYYTSTTLQGLTSVDLKQLDALGFHLAVSIPTVIEAAGSTSLVLQGNEYFLDPTSGGTGPTLKLSGSAVTQGQIGAWAPIGAEAISGGYEVVWKYGNSGSYALWTTDSNGNDLSSSDMTSASVAALESTFHQDLNGDGVISAPASSNSTIEAAGSTSLVLSGGHYFLDPTSGGTGPTLKLSGTAVTQGQIGAWAPIGVEAVSNGYEVVWKYGSSGSYALWTTDSNGNDLNSSDMTSASVAALESTFHQDLNGDGVISAPASSDSTIEAAGSTSLVLSGGHYFLDPTSGGTGPTLKLSGTAVTQGQIGAWAPIGVEAVSNGYEVVWKYGTSGGYALWTTDGNGNDTSSTDLTSASVTALESTFHQDLNGDGVISAASGTTIESAGSTSLVVSGGNYFLNPTSGGTGPTLELGGAPVTQGQIGAWAPIGAEAVSNGYEVVWKYGSSGSYALWTTDSNGNDLSSSDMTSASVATLESTFHQDLNGDGVIGAFASTPAGKAADGFLFNFNLASAGTAAASAPTQGDHAQASTSPEVHAVTLPEVGTGASDPIAQDDHQFHVANLHSGFLLH
ncbi:NF038122 family metalloprotease [Bradyrhizobium diazoefficiens]|nr:NF038122 family metalloprotease [Bradyrhizobium diazoefficiens]QQN62772.1 NF038122 family metalloprotease [Bradyrhizobium diazoefficiens]